MADRKLRKEIKNSKCRFSAVSPFLLFFWLTAHFKRLLPAFTQTSEQLQLGIHSYVHFAPSVKLPPNQSSLEIHTGRLTLGWIKWIWAARLFYRSIWQYRYNKWMKQLEGKSLFNITLLPTAKEQNVWRKE